MHIELRLFGRRIELSTKALSLHPLSQSGDSWFPWAVVRESFTGAWQNNVELRLNQVITNPTLFACVTLIAADVSKLCAYLAEEDEDGIWTETYSPAFSPFLRKPNHYQTFPKFIEQWMVSKLTQGNTYALKQRDQRGLVTAAHVLDPSRVTPLVTPTGDVYYQLRRDDLSGQIMESVTVPASEIFHDRMVCLFHPLIGVTPIFACGAAAMQGLTIQNSASKLFSNSTQPGGILIAPKGIDDTQAARLQHKWQTEFSGDNFGKVAVLGGELQYTPLGMTAVDSQLIDQLKWSDERICSAYHVPPYMVGVGPPPPYANFEPLQISYLSQCLQAHIKNLEDCLDEGLGIAAPLKDGTQYGVEFDIDDLIWMDNQTRTTSAKEGITGGLSFNEVRKKYYGYKPVKGGESPMSQQQNFSIAALAERDANDPFAKPTPAPPQTATSSAEDPTPMPRAASYAAALNRKMGEAGLYAA